MKEVCEMVSWFIGYLGDPSIEGRMVMMVVMVVVVVVEV